MINKNGNSAESKVESANGDLPCSKVIFKFSGEFPICQLQPCVEKLGGQALFICLSTHPSIDFE